MSNDWENPAIFQKNRLRTRAYAIPKEQHLTLNGVWDFHYAAYTALAINPKEYKTFDEWEKIKVPGHWQLQGYGHPQYTNVIYPFPANPPFVPSKNPTGTYRKKFSIPSDWLSGSCIRLRFDGVDSAYYVYVDGVEVGYSQGSRNAAEFDITHLVQGMSNDTEHQLVVKVFQWSDGSYLEDQDQWWLSGIFRDVTLIGFNPLGHIEDFKFDTTFDSRYVDATLNIELDIVAVEKKMLQYYLFLELSMI